MIYKRTFTLLCFIALSVPFADTADAQQPFSFECRFTNAVTAGDKDFSAEAMRLKNEVLQLTFLVADNKAYLLGNVGTGEVFLSKHSDGYTFVEEVPSGAIMVTAVDKKLNAVHSRHPFTPSKSGGWELYPSQYYGKCVLKK